MAALLAAAAEPMPDFPLVSLSSEGVTLIYGRDETRDRSRASCSQDHLDVTVLITRPKDLAPPRVTEFPVVKGTIRSAKGHLGAFELTVDDYAAPRAVLARRADVRRAAQRRGVALRPRARSLRRRAAVSRRTICATAICAPTRAIRPRCCARC